MFKNQVMNVMIGAALLFLVILTAQTYWPSPLANKNQSVVPNTGPREESHIYTGTGDPLRFRVKAPVPNTGPREESHTYAGTGDPLRFRVKASAPDTGPREESHTYAGTGDPLRFRIQPQIGNIPNTGNLKPGMVPNGPNSKECFSSRFTAASDCDRIASDW